MTSRFWGLSVPPRLWQGGGNRGGGGEAFALLVGCTAFPRVLLDLI
jgi:hypothetical protein